MEVKYWASFQALPVPRNLTQCFAVEAGDTAGSGTPPAFDAFNIQYWGTKQRFWVQEVPQGREASLGGGST